MAAVRDLTTDPRAAGEILRYHTWSTHHKQSVGEHTWQIMRILLTVWPRVPRRLLVHATAHDMGEMAGDIAYPFKINFPELKAATVKAENSVYDGMSKGLGAPPLVQISNYEKAVFKVCENLEMWEYGVHEFNMGNKYAFIIARRMLTAVGNGLDALKEEPLSTSQDARQHPGIPEAIHRYISKRTEMEQD